MHLRASRGEIRIEGDVFRFEKPTEIAAPADRAACRPRERGSHRLRRREQANIWLAGWHPIREADGGRGGSPFPPSLFLIILPFCPLICYIPPLRKEKSSQKFCYPLKEATVRLEPCAALFVTMKIQR